MRRPGYLVEPLVRRLRGQGDRRHRSRVAVRHGRPGRRADRRGRCHRGRRDADAHASRHPHEPHAHAARRRRPRSASRSRSSARPRASSTADSAMASPRLRPTSRSRPITVRSPEPFEDPGRLRLITRAEALRHVPRRLRTARSRSRGFDQPSCRALGASADVRPDPRGRSHAARDLRRCTRTPKGKPDGGMAYEILDRDSWWGKPGHVEVHDLFGSPSAYVALWRYLLDIDLVKGVKVEHAAARRGLRWMLADPRRLEMKLEDQLWLRVVDVPGALAARTYGRAGKLVLDVADPFLGLGGRFEIDSARRVAATCKPSPAASRPRDDDRRPRRCVSRRRRLRGAGRGGAGDRTAAPARSPAPTTSSRTTPSPGAAPSSDADTPTECALGPRHSAATARTHLDGQTVRAMARGIVRRPRARDRAIGNVTP